MFEWRKLTVINLIEILIVVVLTIACWSFWYYRYFMETTFRAGDVLSAEVIKDIYRELYNIDIINGVQVVKFDLKKNVRYVIYTDWKLPELSEAYDIFVNQAILKKFPIFTEDEVRNARFVRLLMHEFDCLSIDNIKDIVLIPSFDDGVVMVCSISIPPAFNQFKGMISVTLKRYPTPGEKMQVRSAIVQISERLNREVK